MFSVTSEEPSTTSGTVESMINDRLPVLLGKWPGAKTAAFTVVLPEMATGAV